MTVWLDAHRSPALAPWLAATFGVTATAVRDLGLRDALDPPIFDAARVAGAVVMTKDADFRETVGRLGPPPQVICFGAGTRRTPRSAFCWPRNFLRHWFNSRPACRSSRSMRPSRNPL